MNSRELEPILKGILAEDVGSGDVTMAFTPNKHIKASIIANEKGYVSGLSFAKKIFALQDVKAKIRLKDGSKVKNGEILINLEGSSRRILSTSRSALNLIARMSGITTQTRKYVDMLAKKKYSCCIMATRKTTPLFRYFEKKAVIAGGGLSHRMGLYDMILIKHDYLTFFKGGVKEAIEKARKSGFRSNIEFEVDNMTDAIKAAESLPDVIMLDNMKPSQIKKVLKELERKKLRKKVKIEVSGGINMKNFIEYAKCNVDYISVGELTHSPKSIDVRLKLNT